MPLYVYVRPRDCVCMKQFRQVYQQHLQRQVDRRQVWTSGVWLGCERAETLDVQDIRSQHARCSKAINTSAHSLLVANKLKRFDAF